MRSPRRKGLVLDAVVLVCFILVGCAVWRSATDESRAVARDRGAWSIYATAHPMGGGSVIGVDVEDHSSENGRISTMTIHLHVNDGDRLAQTPGLVEQNLAQMVENLCGFTPPAALHVFWQVDQLGPWHARIHEHPDGNGASSTEAAPGLSAILQQPAPVNGKPDDWSICLPVNRSRLLANLHAWTTAYATHAPKADRDGYFEDPAIIYPNPSATIQPTLVSTANSGV